MKNSTPFATTNSNALAMVFNHELLGQLSDGYWENSKPYDHWKKFVGGVSVESNNSNKVEITFRQGFYSNRQYNFANREFYN